MGIGNLQGALRAYGDERTSYAQLYFDSSPPRHAGGVAAARRRSATTRRPTCGGSTRRARSCGSTATTRAELRALDGAADGEELRRGGAAPAGDDAALRDAGGAARRPRTTATLARAARRARRATGLRFDPRMGELAARLDQPRAPLSRPAARGAARCALYIGARTRESLGGRGAARSSPRPCATTRYQRALVRAQQRGDAQLLAAHDRLGVRHPAPLPLARQALAFQFVLDRLPALNLIAWVREPRAIHVTVAGGRRGAAAAAPSGSRAGRPLRLAAAARAPPPSRRPPRPRRGRCARRAPRRPCGRGRPPSSRTRSGFSARADASRERRGSDAERACGPDRLRDEDVEARDLERVDDRVGDLLGGRPLEPGRLHEARRELRVDDARHHARDLDARAAQLGRTASEARRRRAWPRSRWRGSGSRPCRATRRR